MLRLIGTNPSSEYWTDETTVWRRGKGPAALDVNGNPMDLRWECSLEHFFVYRQTAYGNVVAAGTVGPDPFLEEV